MAAEWVLSVGQLNEYVRRQLAADPILRNLNVRGEISGFKRHYSGHMYFTLKDETSRVQCVMFRQNAAGLPFQPRDGMQVVASASASLYVQGGAYQLYVESMREEGGGDLNRRFEQLKARLAAEGLFDAALKKPLPMLPRCVGVVTSTAGAALRDILRVARRRNRHVSILIAPAAVQGDAAAGEIARALDALNADGTADVILCGRGGGSIEELWAFNEEIVARAIARSRIPVVSCVGHETDFTIADFVADVRAATPSMAAELAVPSLDELTGVLRSLERAMYRAQAGRVALARARLDRLKGSSVLRDPARLLAPARVRLDELAGRLARAMDARLDRERTRLTLSARAMDALNPGAVLERGYALATRGARLITDAGQLSPGEEITLIMRAGRVRARVESIELEAPYAAGRADEPV